MLANDIYLLPHQEDLSVLERCLCFLHFGGELKLFKTRATLLHSNILDVKALVYLYLKVCSNFLHSIFRFRLTKFSKLCHFGFMDISLVILELVCIRVAFCLVFLEHCLLTFHLILCLGEWFYAWLHSCLSSAYLEMPGNTLKNMHNHFNDYIWKKIKSLFSS